MNQNRIVIEVRVRPNSSRSHVGGAAGNPPKLVVAVQAPAVDGKANLAVIKGIAKAFDIRPREIHIVYGELSRDKRVLLAANGADLEKLKIRYLELLDEVPKLL